jgi:hypothetical protein
MSLYEFYLALSLGCSVRNQVEASNCSLFIQSPKRWPIPKKMFLKEILNTVCHTNFLFITMSALWVLFVQTQSGEDCSNMQIIINSMYTIRYYWKNCFKKLSFFHFIFGLVRLIPLAVCNASKHESFTHVLKTWFLQSIFTWYYSNGN